ncbi:hypothetical protein [Comamonas sp. NoAH]|nr:hypothetical protein [Comamonas sp. NoAH]
MKAGTCLLSKEERLALALKGFEGCLTLWQKGVVKDALFMFVA